MSYQDTIRQDFRTEAEVLDYTPLNRPEPTEGEFYVNFDLTVLNMAEPYPQEVVDERILGLLDIVAPYVLKNMGYEIVEVDEDFGVSTYVHQLEGETGPLVGDYKRSRYIRVRNNQGLPAPQQTNHQLVAGN